MGRYFDSQTERSTEVKINQSGANDLELPIEKIQPGITYTWYNSLSQIQMKPFSSKNTPHQIYHLQWPQNWRSLLHGCSTPWLHPQVSCWPILPSSSWSGVTRGPNWCRDGWGGWQESLPRKRRCSCTLYPTTWPSPARPVRWVGKRFHSRIQNWVDRHMFSTFPSATKYPTWPETPWSLETLSGNLTISTREDGRLG